MVKKEAWQPPEGSNRPIFLKKKSFRYSGSNLYSVVLQRQLNLWGFPDPWTTAMQGVLELSISLLIPPHIPDVLKAVITLLGQFSDVLIPGEQSMAYSSSFPMSL